MLKNTYYLLLFILLLGPANLKAQQQERISISLQNVSMREFLEEVKKLSKIHFSYLNEEMDTKKDISVNLKNVTVKELLENVLGQKDMTFVRTGNTVAIRAAKKEAPPKLGSIRGTVTDDNGESLIGVNVRLVDSPIGTITDSEGRYTLSRVPVGNHLVEVSYIGFSNRTVKVDNFKQGEEKNLNITLYPSDILLNETVVTALGIKRSEKALGYAVSTLDSEDVNQTGSSNWLNSLSGKVAGLNMDLSSGGPGSSIRVTLRGEGSLSYDNNTALFVIDGVPFDSSINPSNSNGAYESDDPPVDFGGGASDIDPDNIESITVLKGPSATALYGSRAANGAIIITTKTPSRSKGLGVTINSTTTFEKASFWPDFQTEYGDGSYYAYLNNSEGVYPPAYSFWSVKEGNGDGTTTTVPRSHSTSAFGGRFDGSPRYLYSS